MQEQQDKKKKRVFFRCRPIDDVEDLRLDQHGGEGQDWLNFKEWLKSWGCTVKRVTIFPSSVEMSLTWPGIIKLFLARESLVSDIPAGDGKISNLSYSVEKGRQRDPL